MYYRIYFNLFCILLCLMEVILVSYDLVSAIILVSVHNNRHQDESHDSSSLRFHCLLLHRQAIQIRNCQRRSLSVHGWPDYLGCNGSMRRSWILAVHLRRQVFLSCDGNSQRLRLAASIHAYFVLFCVKAKVARHERNRSSHVRPTRPRNLHHQKIKGFRS